MSIIVKNFSSLFVSKNMLYLALERDGSITMRRGDIPETFFPIFAGMNIPIRKIGMDKNDIIRAFSDLRIQYPLKIVYISYNTNKNPRVK